jgi:hypothetical protein
MSEFVWGVQVGVFRSGRFVNSWFPFFDGVRSPPRQGESIGGGASWFTFMDPSLLFSCISVLDLLV